MFLFTRTRVRTLVHKGLTSGASILAMALGIVLAAPTVSAQTVAANPAPESAADSGDIRSVLAGLYLLSLGDFSMTDQSFTASFWFWTVHQDPQYNANERLEFINTRAVETAFPYRETAQDGKRIWESIQYTVDMRHDWDATFYPFDTQYLQLHMEDSMDSKLYQVFALDTLNSKVAPELSIPGWTLKGFRTFLSDQAYETSFGYPDDPEPGAATVYSRLNIEFAVKREGWGLFLGSYSATLLAFALILIIYRIPLELLDMRMGLVLTALFAVVGNRYSLASSLPPPTGPTFTDALSTSTLLALLFTVSVSVYLHNTAFAQEDEPGVTPETRRALRTLNTAAARATLFSWLVFNGALIYWAHQYG